MRRVLYTALAVLAPLTAHAITLQWPVRCALGTDCFVQNYVDHGAGDVMFDYTCHALTYHGHDGTDIRLRNAAAMRAGVPVVAVADGEVIGVRDGVTDQSIRDTSGHLKQLRAQECGNGVHIRHADGYRTQSCHMRKGSIAVHAGQQVKAGDVIGFVGLSGQTEFPHMHLTVWHDDVVVDPFNAQPMTDSCHTTHPATLWATPMPYIASALLGDGFSSAVPEKAAMLDTPIAQGRIGAHALVLTYWANVMGIQAGDVIGLRITAPDGSVFVEKSKQFDRPMAEYFSFIGKRNHATWPVGTYRAQMILKRGTETIVATDREVVVE